MPPTRFCFAPLVALLAGSSVRAADIQKADVGIAEFLNVGSSWVGGEVPGADDIAVFDATMATAGNNQNRIGGDLTWRGIRVLDPRSVNVASGFGISASVTSGVHTGTLTLGADGIDMSAAVLPAAITTTGFSIGCALTLAADQTWRVPELAAAHDLGLLGSSNRPFNLGGRLLTKSGAGRLTLSSANVVTNGTIDVTEGSINFVNSFAGTSATSGINSIGADVTVRLGPGTSAGFARAPGGGDTAFLGRLRLEGATVNLNGFGLYTGQLNLRGIIDAAAGSSNVFTYTLASTSPLFLLPTISAPLTGTGTIAFRATTTRLDDRVQLAGDNGTFSGIVRIDAPSGNATLSLTSPAAGSSRATWDIAAANTLEIDTDSISLGALAGSGTLTMVNARTGSVTIGSGDFSGTLTNQPGSTLRLVKETTGTLLLMGPATHGGGTDVTAGTLIVAGSMTGAGGSLTVAPGATLAGSGHAGPQVAIAGTIAPGPEVATLTAGSLTFQPGAAIAWEVPNWSGTTWDRLAAATADIAATTAAPVVIRITTPSPAGFTETPRTFRLLTLTSPGSGFDPAKFTIDASALTAGSGTWSLVASGGAGPGAFSALDLVYTPATQNPWTAWLTASGLTGPDAAPDADPDRDGLANAIEFVVGGQPNPARPNADSSSLLPTPAFADGRFTFTWRHTAGAAAASPVVEAASDLAAGPWSPLADGTDGTIIRFTPNAFGQGIDGVTVSVPAPAAGGRLAMRLRAIIP